MDHLLTRTKMKRQLRTYVFAKMSITEALAACQFIEKNISSQDHPLYYPLVTAIFILYARPFDDNNGIGALRKAFSPFSRPDLLPIHQFILFGRNKCYAHLDGKEQYFDVDSKPVGYLHQLTLHVRFESDGKATVWPDIIGPKLLKVFIPKIIELCELLKKKLEISENEWIHKLFTGRKLKEGINRINVFDES